MPNFLNEYASLLVFQQFTFNVGSPNELSRAKLVPVLLGTRGESIQYTGLLNHIFAKNIMWRAFLIASCSQTQTITITNTPKLPWRNTCRTKFSSKATRLRNLIDYEPTHFQIIGLRLRPITPSAADLSQGQQTSVQQCKFVTFQKANASMEFINILTYLPI